MINLVLAALFRGLVRPDERGSDLRPDFKTLNGNKFCQMRSPRFPILFRSSFSAWFTCMLSWKVSSGSSAVPSSRASNPSKHDPFIAIDDPLSLEKIKNSHVARSAGLGWLFKHGNAFSYRN